MTNPAVLVVTGSDDRSEAGLLIELHRAGIRMKVLGPSTGRLAASMTEAGLAAEPLRLGARRDHQAIETIRWHVDDFRPQVLHLMQARSISNGIDASRGRPLRVVAHREIGAHGLRDSLTLLSPTVSRIVCESGADRRSLLRARFGLLRIPDRKVVTIPRGYDMAWYRAAPFDLGLLGVPRSAFVVTCAAGPERQNAVSVLVRACDHLPADLPIHFLLIGSARSVARIRRQTARSRYRDRFHVLGGWADPSEVLAASAVTLLPVVCPTSFDTVAEAMAYGAAPIVGDGGGAELVEEGRSGLIVPSGDARAWAAAILRLYDDRDSCRELGRNARRRIASDLTVEKSAAAMLSLYRELAARDVKRGPSAA